MNDDYSSHVVLGASRGFTVLLVGGAVQPLVGMALPPLGAVWLVLVALAAFVAAARRAGRGGHTVLGGALAASGGYALVLPVSVLGSGQVLPALFVATGATALVVGAATAWVSSRLAAWPAPNEVAA